MELSIGEFSRAARLPVRTIRYYQAEGILAPRRTDPDSGYRYYDDAAMERARVVKKLRELNFSIAEIRELLAGERPGAGDTALLERKVLELEETIARCRTARRELEEFAAYERQVEARAAELGRSVVERSADPLILGGLRVHGSYEELGRHLQAVLRRFGRWAAGGPFTLYHEMEYREQGADYEVCVPLRRAPPPAAPAQAAGADRESGTWSVRSLPRRRCLVTLHRGPYEQIGRSYWRLLAHARSAGAATRLPLEEIYLRGPGMLLPRSPDKYLTEIRLALA
jgi:DNA-binding transcriptional MerR regulator